MIKFKLGIAILLIAVFAATSCKKSENAITGNEPTSLNLGSANVSLAGLTAVQYYVSQTGVYSNPGTSSTAPTTLAKLATITLNPGDIVNFACGSVFSGAVNPYLYTAKGSGVAGNPITFRSYGSGTKPTFTNSGMYNGAIRLQGDYFVIYDLLIKNTGYVGFQLDAGADHNYIRNCEITGTGIAFQIFSSNNLFSHNNIHDLVMVRDDPAPKNDYGAVSFWVAAPDNEISYNVSLNNKQHSYDYGTDGGFVEVYTNGDNTYVHHNFVQVGKGIIETSEGHGANIRVQYNFFYENDFLFAFHADNFTLTNLKFDNNTVITEQGTKYDNLFGFKTLATDLQPGQLTLRNNIFVYGGDGASGKVSEVSGSNFAHTNNIYYLLNGATLGSMALGSGEITGNPLFVNESAFDFHLQSGSPAKNAGINIGYTGTTDLGGSTVGNPPNMGAY